MQTLVQGWTERIKTQLVADGAPFDLTGYATPPASVQMLLYSRLGIPLTFTGSVGLDTPALGIVYFDPGSADLVASQSPYGVRWKITDSAGKSVFFPNGALEEWYVQQP